MDAGDLSVPVSDRQTQPHMTHISEYNEVVRAEQCHFCPQRHNLQTHHIVPQRKNGSDGKENLVIVCKRCHKKLEQIYDKRFYERLGLTDEYGVERSHFACVMSDCRNRATMYIQNKNGIASWFCTEHRDQLDRDARIIKEVEV